MMRNATVKMYSISTRLIHVNLYGKCFEGVTLLRHVTPHIPSVQARQYHRSLIFKPTNNTRKSLVKDCMKAVSYSRSFCSRNKDSGQSLPGKIQPRKYIEYTCKVCNTRNKHTFSKLSYEKGIVIVTCEGCQNRHLIADNLGWFKQTSRNIEELLAEQGENVRVVSNDGTQEIVLDQADIDKLPDTS